MSGSASDPVKLDPAQHVIEVGWRKRYSGGPSLSISASVEGSLPESCGDWPTGEEMLDGDLHVTTFLTGSTIDYSAGGEGGLFTLTPLGGGAGIDCILSNVSGSSSAAWSDWQYAPMADDPDLQGNILATGMLMRLKLMQASELDQSPICRFRLFPLGSSTSSARVTPGAAATASGAAVSAAAITATEIGGLGRVFHPVGVTGGSGTSGSNPWLRNFDMIWE